MKGKAAMRQAVGKAPDVPPVIRRASFLRGTGVAELQKARRTSEAYKTQMVYVQCMMHLQ